MTAQIALRAGVRLDPKIKLGGAAQTRSLSVCLARSDLLVGTIAQHLKGGRTVVLLDVNYRMPLYGQTQSIEALVAAQVGASLASQVINLDHHSQELGKLTATEIVFQKLDELRSLGGKIVAVINHGDTDSVSASYIVNNLDHVFAEDEKALLIAAARAGDHSEGDYTLPLRKLPPFMRLCLALDAICSIENQLNLVKLWRIKPEELDQEISRGMGKAYALIRSALAGKQALYLPETEALVKRNPTRASYLLVADTAKKRIPGVEVHRTLRDYPIVVVDVSLAGRDDFNPLPAYQTPLKPAVILIKRNRKIVGFGRNNDHAAWLDLTGGDRLDSFYSRLDNKYKGGAHAGGANAPLEELYEDSAVVMVATRYIEESLRAYTIEKQIVEKLQQKGADQNMIKEMTAKIRNWLDMDSHGSGMRLSDVVPLLVAWANGNFEYRADEGMLPQYYLGWQQQDFKITLEVLKEMLGKEADHYDWEYDPDLFA